MANGYNIQSNLLPNQEPLAQPIFEVIKSNLAGGASKYLSPEASLAFNRRNVQANFQSQIGGPLRDSWRTDFAPLVGGAGQPYAQGRFNETIGALGAQAGYTGERQAYQEYLRTRPEGMPLDLGQAMLGQTTTASFVEDDTNEWAEIALATLNAAGTAASAYNASQSAPDTSAWQGGSPWPGQTSPYLSDRSSFGGQPFEFDTSGLGIRR